MALTEIDRLVVDLWTARPMQFHVGRGEFRTIPRFTECRKPAYTREMRVDLDRWIRSECSKPMTGNDFWALVMLEGKLRFLRRSDVLNRKEFDEARERDRSSFGVLSKKLRGAVGPSHAHHGGSASGVAAQDGGGGGEGEDPGRERSGPE